MNRQQRYRYEMLGRIRDFGAAHKELFPDTSMGGQSFAAVAAALTTLDQHLSERVVARAEARRVKASTRAGVLDYIKAIARTSRRVTKDETGATPFIIPAGRSAPAVISTARAFIAEAEKRQAEFVKRDLPATFLADFRALVGELEKAVATQLNSQTDRRQAQAGIKDALADATDAVRELDVVVPNALRLDPVRLAAYRGARRIAGLNPSPTSPAKKTAAGSGAQAPAAAAAGVEGPAVTSAAEPDAPMSKAS
jgi:hypothetical protein